jgi:hypothetical protein
MKDDLLYTQHLAGACRIAQKTQGKGWCVSRVERMYPGSYLGYVVSLQRGSERAQVRVLWDSEEGYSSLRVSDLVR